MRQFPEIKLYTAELVYGDRQFEVTEENDPTDFRFRTDNVLWAKERLINLTIQRLPANWKYVAWIDADVIFAKPTWAIETVERLQHYPVMQLFSQATDVSYDHELYKNYSTGFIAAYQKGQAGLDEAYYYRHPGFAWAATRQALDDLGGLLDVAILGSADWHMARALTGIDDSEKYRKRVSKGYAEALSIWAGRAKKYINGNVGYVPGLLLHNHHGPKANRQYKERWTLLEEHGFDPEFDLKVDTQGLYRYSSDHSALEQDIRRYFAQRNEDDIRN